MDEPELITHEDDWFALMGGALSDVPPVLNHDDEWAAYISGVSDVEPDVLNHADEWRKFIAENGGGGDITVEPLTVTENGTYNPGTGKAYKPVTVSVPIPATQEELDSIAEGIGVATPSTPASIEAQVDELIADANTATGEADETLTDAVGSLIDAVPEGGPVYINDCGTAYLKDMDLSGISTLDVAGVSGRNAMYAKCIHMRSMICAAESVGAAATVGTNNLVNGCTALETLVMPKAAYYGHGFASNCTSLKTVQLGSIGHPVTSMGVYAFQNDTQTGLTITVYVDAATTADIVAGVKDSAPWGATNATIIYRNSTTGEIIEEPPEPLGYAWVPSSGANTKPTMQDMREQGFKTGSAWGTAVWSLLCKGTDRKVKVAFYKSTSTSTPNAFVAMSQDSDFRSYSYMFRTDATRESDVGYFNGAAIEYDGKYYISDPTNGWYALPPEGMPQFDTLELALAAMDDGNWTHD